MACIVQDGQKAVLDEAYFALIFKRVSLFFSKNGPSRARNKKETLLLLSKSECLTFVSEERWYNCCKLQLCYVPTRSKDVPKVFVQDPSIKPKQ